MRPALSAKRGSRGKIQLRCCQGRMASSWSHRQTVLPLMRATIPARCTSRATSAVLRRDNGTPRVAGSSHARALTWTTTSGGKSPGATRAGALLEAGQAFAEETLAPGADDIATDRERGGNVIVTATVGRGEDDARPEHLEIRQRIFPGSGLKDLAFLRGERDDVRAVSRHYPPRSRSRVGYASPASPNNIIRGRNYANEYLAFGRLLRIVLQRARRPASA
jgi:hypothetical protein